MKSILSSMVVLAIMLATVINGYAQTPFEFTSDGNSILVIGKGTLTNLGPVSATTFAQELTLECADPGRLYIRSDSSFYEFGAIKKLTLKHSVSLILDDPPVGLISCVIFGVATTRTTQGISVNFAVYDPTVATY